MKNKDLKKRILEISYKLDLGHIGSNITAVDIIDEIYKEKKPDEKFVLSAGHSHLAHLVVMYKELKELVVTGREIYRDPEIEEKLIQQYGIHCDRKAGCDASTGSLGHGIGIAVGMALANRTKNVYCLISDGECAEGSVNEALRIKYEQDLDNLKIYANVNGWGAYREIDLQNGLTQWLSDHGVEVIFTDQVMDIFPKYLQGQEGHYHHLTKKEYKECMEILR